MVWNGEENGNLLNFPVADRNVPQFKIKALPQKGGNSTAFKQSRKKYDSEM